MVPCIEGDSEADNKFKQALLSYVKKGYIDDIMYWIWLEILKKVEYTRWWFIKRETWWLTEVKWSTHNDEATLVMMKEYLMWYRLPEAYDDIKIGWKSISLYNDYNVSLSGWYGEYAGDYKIKRNYTVALRNTMFWWAAEARMRINNLKDRPPLMYDWQYDLKKRMCKRTVFTHIRRSGKTLYLASELISCLLKDNPHSSVRPRSIIYLWEKEKNIFAILNYLLSMKAKFGDLGDKIFKYHKSSKQFSFMDPKTKQPLAVISFIFASENSPGIGHFCDDLFIDEAWRIDSWIVEWVMPFVTHEWAGLMVTSTMYSEIRKWWMYDLLAEYEQYSYEYEDINRLIPKRYNERIAYENGDIGVEELDYRYEDTKIGLRYTIDNDENMNDKRKQELKDSYRKNPVKYFSELYSRFPSEMKVFKYSHTLKKYEKLTEIYYKYIVVWYDPALSSDRAVLAVWGMTDNGKVSILETYELNIENKYQYSSQIESIKSILKVITGKFPESKVFFVMDWTTRAVAEMLMMWGISVNLRIFYWSWSSITHTKSIYNEVQVPKKILVEISKVVFENSKILIADNLLKLQDELDNFTEIATNKYEAIKGHDDYVNAMMLVIFYLYENMWLKYTVVNDIAKKTDNGMQIWVENNRATRSLTLEQMIKEKENDSIIGSSFYSKFIY